MRLIFLVGCYNLYQMSKIQVTQKDCVQFTFGMLHMLETNGFHIHSIQEAAYCLDNIIQVQVSAEISKTLEDLKCPSCNPTFGLKNTVPIN